MSNLKTAREYIKSIKNLENDPNFLNIRNEKKFEDQNLKNKNTSRLKACLVIIITKYDNNAIVGVNFFKIAIRAKSLKVPASMLKSK